MASGFADICSLGGPGRRPTEHPVYYNFDVGCEEDTCGPCLGHLELGLKDICGDSCDAETGKCILSRGD
ncbi:hypothetical protein JCM8202v2_001750 [Rhodotorula sphaerocarpa]